MAKYTVECTKCKEEFQVGLLGKHKTKQYILENTEWVCEDCKQKEYEELNNKAKEEAKSLELIELEGSEKQIAWAETIRMKFVNSLDNEIEYLQKNIKDFDFRITTLLKKEKASFWIDNRLDNLESLLKQIPERIETIKKTIDKNLEIEAEIEATIRPEEVESETIAKIIINDKKISIHFPERNDNFRKLINLNITIGEMVLGLEK